MSDGLRKVSGACGEIRLGERNYRLSPLTLGMRGEIEAHVVARRPNLLEKVAASLDKVPQEHQAALLEAALRQMDRSDVASDEEVAEYLESFAGTALLLWLLVREQQPEVDTLDKAVRLAGSLSLDDLQDRLDRATGLADLKNSAGPAAAAGLAGSEMTTAGGLHGRPSTASSPESTSGNPSG